MSGNFDDDSFPTLPAKKDTKKWCKGKEGREHKLAVASEAELHRRVYYIDGKMESYGKNNYIQYCTVCGKELDHYWHFQKEKPKWLIEYLK